MILLIIKVMRCIKSRVSSHATVGDSSSILHSVIDYLQSNYAHSVNLNELALKSFYSKNYLCTLFKETTGSTISQYIQNLRVKEACRLLETTPTKITDIASLVGFSDYKTFNASFKRITGLTPKNYRVQKR